MEFIQQLATFLAGGATTTVGHAVAHRYSVRRDRRAEFATLLDQVVRAFLGGDRAISGLITSVKTRDPVEAIHAAGNRVTDFEVEILATLFSIEARLGDDHRLCVALEEAQEKYAAIADLILPGLEGHDFEDQARQGREEFRAAFRAAMDVARDTLRRDVDLA